MNAIIYRVALLMSFLLFTSGCQNDYRYRLVRDNPTKAVTVLSQQLENNGSDVDLLVFRGCAYIKLRDWAKAYDDFDYVLAISPQNKFALYNRGLINYSMGKFDAAINDMTSAINVMEDKTERAKAHVFRGALYHYDLKDYKQAMIDYDAAAELDGDNNRALINKAILLSNTERYPEAIRLFDQVLLRDEENSKVLNDYAWFLAIAPEPYRNTQKSLQLAELAVKVFPNAVTYDTLGLAYAANHDFVQAEKAQVEAIKAFNSANILPGEYPQMLIELNNRLADYQKKEMPLIPLSENRPLEVW
jgi:tetratricopeptide (TPR) repeat protein